VVSLTSVGYGGITWQCLGRSERIVLSVGKNIGTGINAVVVVQPVLSLLKKKRIEIKLQNEKESDIQNDL